MTPGIVAVLNGLLAVLAVAGVLAFVRLARGASLPDRVAALDLVASVGVAMCGLFAIVTDRSLFLDVALVLALISFIGTVGVARYLERRGRR